jgi:TolB-like protein
VASSADASVLSLLHAPTDTHLWARDYERELTDVLRLQNEVARLRRQRRGDRSS